MPLTDREEALTAVRQFLQLLREVQNPGDAWEGAFANPREEPAPFQMWPTFSEYERDLKAAVIGLQPLMEDIAGEIDRGLSPFRFAEHPIDGWGPAEEASRRLLGILNNASRRERILGPVGPVLAAGGLHPWVWNAAASLWDDKHYKQAVHSAWNAVEQQTQLKLSRADLSGKKLYAEAFKLRTGRLRFAHIEQETEDGKTIPDWTSAHEGAMHFGMGCAQGIRNVQAHSTEDLSEEQALEYLAALSVLARWVHAAQVVPAGDA